ncbi:MAG: hypothetical protein Q8N05_18260 [Bacteroidota bacterium]|nr:hypothetical protein [Bacteroidota bacterium]
MRDPTGKIMCTALRRMAKEGLAGVRCKLAPSKSMMTATKAEECFVRQPLVRDQF